MICVLHDRITIFAFGKHKKACKSLAVIVTMVIAFIIIIGGSGQDGTRSWFNVFGVSVQLTELLKIPFVYLLSTMVEKDYVNESYVANNKNNGTMMKPYVVETNTERGFFEELFNMNSEVKPEVLAKIVISKKTAKRITDALEYTAVEGYGLPEGCIIGKSGTAELPNGKNQLWLCVATEDYSICISITSRGYSSALVEPMKKILDFIENNEF